MNQDQPFIMLVFVGECEERLPGRTFSWIILVKLIIQVIYYHHNCQPPIFCHKFVVLTEDLKGPKMNIKTSKEKSSFQLPAFKGSQFSPFILRGDEWGLAHVTIFVYKFLALEFLCGFYVVCSKNIELNSSGEVKISNSYIILMKSIRTRKCILSTFFF